MLKRSFIALRNPMGFMHSSLPLLGLAQPTRSPLLAPNTSQQAPKQISSPYELLRLVLRSIELKVRSRHAREFLRKRVISQWRLHRNEPDPQKQRFLMERAATTMSALHMTGKSPEFKSPIEHNFDRPTRTTIPK
jgi:hypothetical protein